MSRHVRVAFRENWVVKDLRGERKGVSVLSKQKQAQDRLQIKKKTDYNPYKTIQFELEFL